MGESQTNYLWLSGNKHNPACGSKAIRAMVAQLNPSLSKELEKDQSVYVLVFGNYMTFTPHMMNCIAVKGGSLEWLQKEGFSEEAISEDHHSNPPSQMFLAHISIGVHLI